MFATAVTCTDQISLAHLKLTVKLCMRAARALGTMHVVSTGRRTVTRAIQANAQAACFVPLARNTLPVHVWTSRGCPSYTQDNICYILERLTTHRKRVTHAYPAGT